MGHLALDIVTQEKSVLQTDPLQLIADASTEIYSGKSPYSAILNLKDYLKNQKPDSFVVGSHERLYNETVNKLEKISAVIKEVMTASADQSLDQSQLSELIAKIFKEAELEQGTTFLSNRIERSLRIAMNEILISNKSNLDVGFASKLLASEDVLRELTQFSGNSDLNTLYSDLTQSQIIVERSLQTFLNMFETGITRGVKDAYTSDGYTKTIDPRRTRSLGEMCLRLLSVPNLDSRFLKNLCDQNQVESIFKDGPKSVKITEGLYSAPLEQRICSYRNFMRTNRIFQVRFEREKAKPQEVKTESTASEQIPTEIKPNPIDVLPEIKIEMKPATNTPQ